jgi:hypothetical protein
MSFKRAIQGCVAAGVAAIAGSAGASQVTQQQCFTILVPGPPDCGCNNCDSDTPPNPPMIVCYPGPTESQQQCQTVTVEELTTPIGVSRYSNGSDFQYTVASPDPGYVFEARAFSLANDDYQGAVPFYSMSDGTRHALSTDPSQAPGYWIEEQLGYIFPTTNNGFIPLSEYVDPLQDEAFDTVSLTDASALPCPSPTGEYNFATFVFTPPDCFIYETVLGYVGF